MTQFRKKPVVITAITFDQLVAHGLTQTKAVANGLPWAFEYGGHPITHESDDCYLIPTLEGTMKMGRADMLITGVQGEIYPCKADIFAATYDAVPAAPEPTPSAQADQHIESGMTFGAAIEALKVGQSVARAGWNGKGMFVYLVPAASYPAQTGAAKAYFGKDALVPYAAYLALKNVDGTVNTWAPSVSDALAEDWALAP